MKRLAWLGVVLLTVACPAKKQAPVEAPVDAGPAQVAEKEPNDRPEQAQVLAGSSIVTGSLTADPSRTDEDWYLLSSSAPKTVDLRVSAVPGVDVKLEIYDTDRNRIALVNSEGEGKPERFPNLGVNGKTYVLVTATRRGNGGAYTLSADFTDPASGFETEPNNRAADSNELRQGDGVAEGWKVSGFIGHSGDEDWYRVDLQGQATAAPSAAPDAGGAPADAGSNELPPPAPAVPLEDGGLLVVSPPVDAGPPPPEPKLALHIELTPVEGVAPELQILSAAQAPLFFAHAKLGEGLSLRNVGVRANDQMVYVVVKSGWSTTGKDARRGYNAEKPYTLTLTQEAAGTNAELEPNDDATHATPLPLEGFREGFLSPKSDVDYYVLRTPQPVLANVQLSGVEHLDLVLMAIKPSEKAGAAETVLLKSNDGAVKEPEYLTNVLCVSECYFKVEGALRKVNGKFVREFENSEQPYRLTISTTPDTGAVEREPNDTAELATPVSLGQPIRGTISPKRDVDFYKLDLSGRPVKTSLKATVTGILKVDIALRLYRQTESGLELVQTSDKGKADAPEVVQYAADPGVYFLEVRDSKNRESNFQDAYQLTVEEGE